MPTIDATTAVTTTTAEPNAAVHAQQDDALVALLAGAQALLVRLQALQDDITAKAATYATAKTTLANAITALPAAPTAAQTGTFLKGPLATYLNADNAATVALGTDLNGTITELENTVRGLGNVIARLTGSTTVLS